MYIDGNSIVEVGKIVGAIITVGGVAIAIVKWFFKQEKQDQDIKLIKEEQCLMMYALLACLDGLKQLNCNGSVTKAHEKIEKHLNQKAHDQL